MAIKDAADDGSALQRQLVDKLLSFSNGLMVTLIAVMAFVAAAITDANCFWSKLFFVVSLVGALVSMWFGYRANISWINANFRIGKEFELVKPSVDDLQRGLMKVKCWVQWQYYFSAGSGVCVSVSLVVRFWM